MNLFSVSAFRRAPRFPRQVAVRPRGLTVVSAVPLLPAMLTVGLPALVAARRSGFPIVLLLALMGLLLTPLARAESVAERWWSGKSASGDWFGVRPTLEDRGITIQGRWRADFLGVVDGGTEQRGGFDQELNFDLNIDFAKLTGWSALEGLTFTGNTRWRDGKGITEYAGTDSTFRPSSYSSGQQWRLRKLYLTYTTPRLFGIEDFLEISGGWQVPTDLFLVQPESKLFVNHSIRTAKGINPNLPWSGTFSTWGGYVQVKPTQSLYARAGLYLAYPFGTSEGNHALSFAGYQIDPSLNGVYSINEVGFTPEIGASRLPGKYAAGLIYWGVQNTAFNGQANEGRLQLYWQADQMLFREPTTAVETAPADGKSLADGKDVVSKEPVTSKKPTLSKQGLYLFSTINYAPPTNNQLPFYVLGGLVYKGLVPTRDDDQTGVAFAYGAFSEDEQNLDRSRGRDPRTYQAVLEADYRIQLNRFAYVQPTAQYVIRPGGRGLVENAFILGLHFGANF